MMDNIPVPGRAPPLLREPSQTFFLAVPEEKLCRLFLLLTFCNVVVAVLSLRVHYIYIAGEKSICRGLFATVSLSACYHTLI